jgi:amino acid transporter
MAVATAAPDATPGGAGTEPGGPGTKGLKTGALGYVSNVVIGVASTAPAYSLAVSLGLVAAFVGLQAPAIMWVAFIPMLCIAMAYYYMNRADPDCGTSFTWVKSALGPHMGWMTGWAIIVADIVVIASLAEVAAQYTISFFYNVFGTEQPDYVLPFEVLGQTIDGAVLVLGILFVIAMTWICYRGIELSARTQVVLLAIELLMLGLFSAVALYQVYAGLVDGSVMPDLSWINPLAIVGEDGGWNTTAFTSALVITLFIYWGWDTTAAVNEESANPTEQPGRATVISVLILVATYVLVTVAAQALHGAEYLAAQGEGDVFAALAEEVLGFPWVYLMIFAVLSSAAASTQTTILPTARTALSMGAKGALPKFWAEIHPRYLTPTNATIWMGVLSIVWYVVLKLMSENVYYDALTALGLMIAFYYGLTGLACVVYYRKVMFTTAKNFLGMFLLPMVGFLILAWAFFQSIWDLTNPLTSYTCTDPEDVATCAQIMGISIPLALSIFFLIAGLVLMVIWQLRAPAFFRRPWTSKFEEADTAA